MAVRLRPRAPGSAVSDKQSALGPNPIGSAFIVYRFFKPVTPCAQCGTPNDPVAGYCEKCGQPLASATVLAAALPATAAPGPPGKASTNSLAVASLLLGIFSLFPPFGILAVIFGHVARSQIRKSAGRQKGAGMALAGLILAYLALGFVLFVIFIVLPALNWR